MNKAELSVILAKNIGENNIKAVGYVNEVFKIIIETLEHGENISISDFGKFEITKTKARQGRNPKTGENVDIPAKRVVKFKPGSKLKNKLNIGPL